MTYYGGRSFTWEGRELQTFTNGSSTASYVYNENGIRTQKTVNGVTTSFLVDGSTIRFSLSNDLRLSFLYYGNELVGFKTGNDTYYYLKNLQGDIVQIVDGDGNVVVEYEYDDWGKVLSVTGTLAGTVGAQNPFRYRGYYYDEESGLYYLNSRYYDPETGRFISADMLIVAGSDVLGANLFAYWEYNPISYADDFGSKRERADTSKDEGEWRLIGVGVQLDVSASVALFSCGLGVEIIIFWDTNETKQKGEPIVAIYFYEGGNVDLKLLVNDIYTISNLLIDSVDLLKIDGTNCLEAILRNSEHSFSAGISLSAFAVFGNERFTNTNDYCGRFETITVGAGKAHINYAYSECCKTIGAGGTLVGGTAGISFNRGSAFYQLLCCY